MAAIILAAVGLCVIKLNHVPQVQGLTNEDVRQIRAELSPFIHGHPFVYFQNWRSRGIGNVLAATVRILPFELRKELLMRAGKVSRNTDGSIAVQLLEGKSLYGTFNLKRERDQWSLYNCEIPGVGMVELR